MQNSSARPQSFDFSQEKSTEVPAGAADLSGGANQASNSDTGGGARFPNFGVSRDLYAIASRRAGRLNAASVSDDELQALLNERQALLDKKFAGTMTRADEIRMTYLGWSLDRIEDARYGEHLDALENWVTEYQKFQVDIAGLQKELSKHNRTKRR
jgi:hypothetical protein